MYVPCCSQVQLQYSDPRLATSACAGGLASSPSLLDASAIDINERNKAETILEYRSVFYNAPLLLTDSGGPCYVTVL